MTPLEKFSYGFILAWAVLTAVFIGFPMFIHMIDIVAEFWFPISPDH